MSSDSRPPPAVAPDTLAVLPRLCGLGFFEPRGQQPPRPSVANGRLRHVRAASRYSAIRFQQGARIFSPCSYLEQPAGRSTPPRTLSSQKARRGRASGNQSSYCSDRCSPWLRARSSDVKDQYFGDVNDYRKYGLLRALGHAGLKTLVVWMLTPNDRRSDGRFTDYLDKPSHWKRYDKELYEALHDWVNVSRARRVASIEHSTLLPAATFFSSRVPDDGAGRERYADGLMQAAGGAEVVFLDRTMGWRCPRPSMVARIPRNTSTGRRSRRFRRQGDPCWSISTIRESPTSRLRSSVVRSSLEKAVQPCGDD